VKKALINIPCGMEDTLDSYFVGVFVNGIENNVTAKGYDANTSAEAFPQWGTVRRLHNQEAAVTDFSYETVRPPWIITCNVIAYFFKIPLGQR
jgi:hypothetical protein